MSEVQQTLVMELLKPVLDAWSQRHERKAARDAGSLMFWPDGMLKQLEIIANGKASQSNFEELESMFKQSSEHVSETMDRLVDARNRLAGTEIARQINTIIFSNSGKSSIRREISEIIAAKDNFLNGDDYKSNDALMICNIIRHFNSEVERLSRMIQND
jgi:hypothetical protein